MRIYNDSDSRHFGLRLAIGKFCGWYVAIDLLWWSIMINF